MPRSLLIIEVGRRAGRDIRRGFVAEGFKVDTASGLAHAQSMSAMRDYNALVIFAGSHRHLKECLDPLTDCDRAKVTPVVFLAELDESEQTLVLERGGSAYLPSTTPFPLLLAQLRALFDVAEGFPVHYRIHDLGIDPVARRASRGGRPLVLRPREFDLLLYLAERAERTVEWQDLHGKFWPHEEISSGRVAIQIHNLRRAIGAPRTKPLLHTVRGNGYTLSAAQPRHMRSRQ